MSVRRFVAYFLALSAGSTVAFASTLMGQPAPPEAALAGAMSEPAPEQTTRLLQAMRRHPRRKPAAKIAQVALLK